MLFLGTATMRAWRGSEGGSWPSVMCSCILLHSIIAAEDKTFSGQGKSKFSSFILGSMNRVTLAIVCHEWWFKALFLMPR